MIIKSLSDKPVILMRTDLVNGRVKYKTKGQVFILGKVLNLNKRGAKSLIPNPLSLIYPLSLIPYPLSLIYPLSIPYPSSLSLFPFHQHLTDIIDYLAKLEVDNHIFNTSQCLIILENVVACANNVCTENKPIRPFIKFGLILVYLAVRCSKQNLSLWIAKHQSLAIL